MMRFRRRNVIIVLIFVVSIFALARTYSEIGIGTFLSGSRVGSTPEPNHFISVKNRFPLFKDPIELTANPTLPKRGDLPGRRNRLDPPSPRPSQAKKHEKSPVVQCSGGVIAATYATHPGSDDKFCRTMLSAAASEIPLVVLGWGKKWSGLVQKFYGMLGFVEALPDDCDVMFNDAYDVLYTTSLDFIRREFRRRDKDTNDTILFSAECGCWPQIQRGMSVCVDDYPRSPTRYRYLNSGQWIARAGTARALLKTMAAKFVNGGTTNDQEIASDLYMQNRTKGLTLDVFASIFQSMHYTSGDLPDCNPQQDVVMTHYPFQNTETRTSPMVFHFNGNGKNVMEAMEKVLPYRSNHLNSTQLMKLKKHVFWFVNETDWATEQITLEELCPLLILPSVAVSDSPHTVAV